MGDDTNANRVSWLIERNGYTVSTEADSIAATLIRTGETFIVRNYLDRPDVLPEPVADVQDVESGEIFRRIPLDKLQATP